MVVVRGAKVELQHAVLHAGVDGRRPGRGPRERVHGRRRLHGAAVPELAEQVPAVAGVGRVGPGRGGGGGDVVGRGRVGAEGCAAVGAAQVEEFEQVVGAAAGDDALAADG